MNTKSFLRAIATVLTLAATWLTGVAQAETVVSVTQVSYDTMNHPVCTAVRMNPVVFASLPADPCTLATTGSYGPDRITKNTYDVAGQLTDVVRALNITTGNGFPATLQQTYAHYTYTNNGLKQTETDANSNLTRYIYDGRDRLSEIDYPQVAIGAGASNGADNEHYGYDANGNRTSWKRRDGYTIGFTYDNLNREIIKDLPATPDNIGGTAKDVYTSYDSLGRVASRNFASTGGSGVSYTYDGMGRVASTTDMNGRTLWYGYNAASARTSMAFGSTNVQWNNVDGANRLSAIYFGAALVISQGYDSLGRRTSLTRQSGFGTTYGYDNFGRLTSLTNDLYGAGADITWGFQYNPASQLLDVSSSANTYVYTEPANASPSGRSFDGLNRDVAYATPTTACGTGGATGPGFDARGNLICDGVRKFTYDIENRLLTKVSTEGQPNLTLTYDPEGRLASYTAGTVTTQFEYDGVDLVAEYDSGGNVTARYLHGTGTDEPLVWINGSGSSDIRFFYYDYHGSVVGYSDPAGTLLQLYKYDAYGVPKGASNLDNWDVTGARFRYTGQILMPEARLYDYKARVYDPSMGRFLQTDPIGSGDDLDLYAYVKGDPVNGSDPTGMFFDDSNISMDQGTESTRAAGGVDGGDAKPEYRTQQGGRNMPDDMPDGYEADPEAAVEIAPVVGVIGLGLALSSFAPHDLADVTNIETKLDNIINDHLTQRDLDAARLELRGQVVAVKGSGVAYDHVNEVRDSQNGLIRQINRINGLLNRSNLSGQARERLEAALSRASKALDYSKNFVPRVPKQRF